MATLQKIRNRAGVLIAIIVGVALFAFVLGDLFRSGNSIFSDTDFDIVEINGESIPLAYYQQKVEEMVDNYKSQSGQTTIDDNTIEMIRDQAWDFMLREALMNEQFEKLGLSVSSDELFDMVQGNNIDPQIMQIPIFKNEAGMFDRGRVIQYLKSLESNPEQKDIWLNFEEGLMKNRVNSKYNNMIKKGYYVPGFRAKAENIYKNRKSSINYIFQRFNSISDSAVTLTEEDLKNYYNEHLSDYEQESSRDIDYVAFDIVASPEDILATKKWVEDAKKDFEESDNDGQFVRLNSDEAYSDNFLKLDEMPLGLDTILFDAEVGTIYGPYEENGSFKLTKLSETRMLPDSVKARHILIPPDQKTGDYSRAKEIVDSLKTLVENGADFEVLASQYGNDATKDKGGDLGWFKRSDMVYPFNDTCFFSEKGRITTVTTQFGVHLVQVMDKSEEVKKVKIATLVRNIEPSSATYQALYSQASEFAGLNNTKDKFEKAISEQGLAKRIANNILENDKRISGLDNPRELIRWAFAADVNDVSHVFELGSRFVVAMVRNIREEGTAPLDQVRNEIEVKVIKEKKAAKISEEMNSALAGASDLQSVSSKLGIEMKSIDNITFSMNNVPGLGVEPIVIAGATSFEKGKISKPLVGNNGVYIIQVTDIVEAPEATDFTFDKMNIERDFQSRVDYQAFEAIKKNTDITDYRAKYY